jgi:hypothetical protein
MVQNQKFCQALIEELRLVVVHKRHLQIRFSSAESTAVLVMLRRINAKLKLAIIKSDLSEWSG